MSQDFASLLTKATQVRDHYNELQAEDGHTSWGVSERMSGLVGDIGMLSKLIMAKQGLRRDPENLDAELAHELADCLWSILIIADELDIDLESEFLKVAEGLANRIERQKNDPNLLH